MTETPAGYFEELWATSDDPWDHARRWYETRKYDLTVSVLPHVRYRHAVEAACGTGLLTERLARRADRVDATDRFDAAVRATAARCSGLDVAVECRDVRDGPPVDGFDLAVLGEVLYYFDVSTVGDVLRGWHRAGAAAAHLVLVHYRLPVAEHVLAGDDVHAVARDVLGAPVVSVVDPRFLIDVFGAPPVADTR